MSHSSPLISSVAGALTEAVVKPIIGATGAADSNLGPDLVVNGSFDTDTSWNKGSGWSISGGTANASSASSYFFQLQTELELNATYQVTYTITSYTSGTVRTGMGFALNADPGTVRSAAGTYTENIQRTTVNDNDDNLGFLGSGFTGSIDDFIVRKILS